MQKEEAEPFPNFPFPECPWGRQGDKRLLAESLLGKKKSFPSTEGNLGQQNGGFMTVKHQRLEQRERGERTRLLVPPEFLSTADSTYAQHGYYQRGKDGSLPFYKARVRRGKELRGSWCKNQKVWLWWLFCSLQTLNKFWLGKEKVEWTNVT